MFAFTVRFTSLSNSTQKFSNNLLLFLGCFCDKASNSKSICFWWFLLCYGKGQIMSECIFGIFQNTTKKFDRFCPGRFYRLGRCNLFWLFSRQLYSGECKTYLVWINFQIRNLWKNLGGILEKLWFHEYILTSSDL